MKVLAIILTCALIGVMGWLIFSSNNSASATISRSQMAGRNQPAAAGQMATDPTTATPVMPPLAARATPPAMIGTTPAPSSLPAPRPPQPQPGVPTTTLQGSTPAVTAALQAAAVAPMPMTQRQRQIKAMPPIAEVKHYAKDYGFVEITAGAARKIDKDQSFAIRRDSAIIARIKVTEVDADSAVADVDSRSLTPGVTIEVGDEVIQNLPPE
jgi:hypothetical protein